MEENGAETIVHQVRSGAELKQGKLDLRNTIHRKWIREALLSAVLLDDKRLADAASVCARIVWGILNKR